MLPLLFALGLLAPAEGLPNTTGTIKGHLYLKDTATPFPEAALIYLVPVDGREAKEQEITYQGNEKEGRFEAASRKNPPPCVLENDLIVKVRRTDGSWFKGHLQLDKNKTPSPLATLEIVIDPALVGKAVLSVKDPVGMPGGAFSKPKT